jgi:hypothetical protein
MAGVFTVMAFKQLLHTLAASYVSIRWMVQYAVK